jgi:hypothetical protein
MLYGNCLRKKDYTYYFGLNTNYSVEILINYLFYSLLRRLKHLPKP